MSKPIRLIFEPFAGESAAAFIPYEVDVTLKGEVVRVVGHFGHSGAPANVLIAEVPDDADATLLTPDARLSLLVGETE